jgi:hypothetical protein
MENFRSNITDKRTVSSPSLYTRSAYRPLSSLALTHLTGSTHAPPVKCIRADRDSQQRPFGTLLMGVQ